MQTNDSRADLQAKLSSALERQIQIEHQIRTHITNLEHIRKAFGNPYFFEPRPDDDAESRSKYTGYNSHEPGLRLLRTWQDVQREIAEILGRLNASAEASKP